MHYFILFYLMNTTVYVFKLNEDKYYISEFNNDIIEPIEKMIEKLVPNNVPEKIQSLLTQNLGTTISSLEWIKKYPIKSVCKTNYDLEKITSNYMRNHGIENVRSDLYKDVELSEDTIEYINYIIKESSEPISKRIKQIDFEISKFKKIFDIITNNNNIISKYEKYSYRNFAHNHQKIDQYNKNNEIRIKVDNNNSINLLSPEFKEILNDKFYADYFSNHKIVEEITNASLLKKKNEKLIFKYGTLEQINHKLTTMLYKKIDLINSLEFNEISDEEII